MKIICTEGENYPYDQFGMGRNYFLVEDFEADKYMEMIRNYIEDLPDCPSCGTMALAHIGMKVIDPGDIRQFLKLPKRAYPTPEEQRMIITMGSIQEKVDLLEMIHRQKEALLQARELILKANELVPDTEHFDSSDLISEIEILLDISGGPNDPFDDGSD